MTLDERARTIACTIADLLNYRAISRQNADNFDAFIQELAAELRSVVEEETMKLIALLEIANKNTARAKSEAYADAARIVEGYPGKWSTIVLGKKIRARAGELK